MFVPSASTTTATNRQFHLILETLIPVLVLGFPLSLQYYLPRAKDRREKSVYMTQTLAFLFAAAVAAIGIYIVMSVTLGGGMGAMVRAFFWRICAYTGLTVMTYYMEWLFAAEHEVGRQAWYHAVVNSLQAVVVMTLAWVYRDVSAMIWGLTVFALARFVFSMIYTFARYRPSIKLVSMQTIKEQLAFALPVGLFGIVLILLNQTDKFIINRLPRPCGVCDLCGRCVSTAVHQHDRHVGAQRHLSANVAHAPGGRFRRSCRHLATRRRKNGVHLLPALRVLRNHRR